MTQEFISTNDTFPQIIKPCTETAVIQPPKAYEAEMGGPMRIDGDQDYC